MKDSQLNEILFDLYSIDESLKEQEQELKDIILEIYYSKPDTEFDDKFKQDLKNEIFLKIKSLNRDHINKKIQLSENLSNKSNVKNIKSKTKESNFIIFMKKISYILGGATVATLALLAIMFYMIKVGELNFAGENNVFNGLKQNLSQSNNNSNKNINNSKDNISNSVQIKNVASNAFGTISSASLRSSTGGENAGVSPQATSMATNDAALGFGVTASAPAGADSKIAIYNPTFYTYNYTDSNDKLNYNPAGLEVLKRVAPSGAVFNSNIVNINDINLSSFKNLVINNISLDENVDNGYSVYYNFNDGSLSINKNWQKATIVNNDRQLKESDVPTDDAIIKIANDFISAYGINIKNYGSPEVNKDWKTAYATTVDKDNYYIPSSMTVVYPLIINGKNVYETYGNKVGLSVMVDIITNKVDNVYGIQSQNYESSKYDLETDVSKILNVAKIGGDVYSYKYTDSKEVSMNIKNPTIAYMRSFKYSENSSTSEELLVPAIVFNIDNTNNTANNNEFYNYKENIIVPLTKDYINEILNRDTKNIGGGEIMPLLERK